MSDIATLIAKVDKLQSNTDEVTKWFKSPQFSGEGQLAKVHATAIDHKAEGQMGWPNFSAYCRDVMSAHTPGGGITKCLKSWSDHQLSKAPSGLNEVVGAEGAFLVPPTFANELLQRTYSNELLKLTREYTAGSNSNSLTIPAIDETSRADGSRFGGIRCYWEAEANQFTATKPAYSQVNLNLHTLLGLAYGTGQLIADSGIALEQHLYGLLAQEVAFKIGDAIINGSGAGMPQGILNAPALVSVSKETGQAATTLVKENIDKMWSRMYAPSRKTAVWLINQDVEPQLDNLAINVGTGGMPVYLPPGGISDTPYARLKGRPVMPTEFNATLGTVGDIVLCDFSQYLTLRKGETESAASIHLRFDYNETAFRVIFRVDGKCWWQSALTPFRGSSNTQSPFVALSTRS